MLLDRQLFFSLSFNAFLSPFSSSPLAFKDSPLSLNASLLPFNSPPSYPMAIYNAFPSPFTASPSPFNAISSQFNASAVPLKSLHHPLMHLHLPLTLFIHSLMRFDISPSPFNAIVLNAVVFNAFFPPIHAYPSHFTSSLLPFSVCPSFNALWSPFNAFSSLFTALP